MATRTAALRKQQSHDELRRIVASATAAGAEEEEFWSIPHQVKETLDTEERGTPSSPVGKRPPRSPIGTKKGSASAANLRSGPSRPRMASSKSAPAFEGTAESFGGDTTGSDELRYAESTTSSFRKSKRKKKGGKADANETFKLQEAVRDFTKRTEDTKVKIKDLEHEIDLMKREVNRLEKSRGGFQAVARNDAFVAKQISIMEKRIVKAQTEHMSVIDNNNALRRAINIWRREKGAVVSTNDIIEKDIDRLQKENDELSATIKKNASKTDEVENEIMGVQSEAQMQEERLEQKWKDLDGGEIKAAELPPPPGDAQVAARLRHEHRLRKDIARSRWQMGFMQASLEGDVERVLRIRSVYKEISDVTGCNDVDVFVQKYLDVEARNYTLFERVGQLGEEAESLRSELKTLSDKTRRSSITIQTEDAERKGVLEVVDAKLKAAEDALKKQHDSYVHTRKAHATIKAGLKTIYDTLDMPEEEHRGLYEGKLSTYYSVVEEQIRNVLVHYLQHVQPRFGSSSSMSRRPVALSPVRDEGSLRKRSVDLSVVEMKRSATEPGPLVTTETVVVGPLKESRSVGASLNVAPPSTDGPKDERQHMAFTAPWKTGEIDDTLSEPMSARERTLNGTRGTRKHKTKAKGKGKGRDDDEGGAGGLRPIVRPRNYLRGVARNTSTSTIKGLAMTSTFPGATTADGDRNARSPGSDDVSLPAI